MQERTSRIILTILVLIAVFLSGVAATRQFLYALSDAEPINAHTVTAAHSGDDIKDYIMANPGVVYDALRLYQKEQQALQEQDAQDYLKKSAATLLTREAPVLGNTQGSVTLFEFFDYNCHFCKQVEVTINQLLATNKDVKLVHKQFPILAPSSMTAAEIALASQKQGMDKYKILSDKLFAFQGKLEDDDIKNLAIESGLNWEQLEKDRADPVVKQEINNTMEAARKLQLNGTPVFIVGSEIIRGAAPLSDINAAIAKAKAPVATSDNAEEKSEVAPAATVPVTKDDNAEKAE